MSVVRRAVVFFGGTVANAILFIFLSRALLPIIEQGNAIAGTGPATSALDLLPVAMQLVIGGFQLGLIVYMLGGLGSQRKTTRRPLQ